MSSAAHAVRLEPPSPPTTHVLPRSHRCTNDETAADTWRIVYGGQWSQKITKATNYHIVESHGNVFMGQTTCGRYHFTITKRQYRASVDLSVTISPPLNRRDRVRPIAPPIWMHTLINRAMTYGTSKVVWALGPMYLEPTHSHSHLLPQRLQNWFPRKAVIQRYYSTLCYYDDKWVHTAAKGSKQPRRCIHALHLCSSEHVPQPSLGLELKLQGRLYRS